MADGTRKPIKDVRVGDTVLATDPETGESGPRRVTTLIQGDGEKRLVDVTLKTDGSAGLTARKITAADGHPFWVTHLEQLSGRRRLFAALLQRRSECIRLITRLNDGMTLAERRDSSYELLKQAGGPGLRRARAASP
jgi:hypothetical protein